VFRELPRPHPRRHQPSRPPYAATSAWAWMRRSSTSTAGFPPRQRSISRTRPRSRPRPPSDRTRVRWRPTARSGWSSGAPCAQSPWS
jgi:hypothetical protein